MSADVDILLTENGDVLDLEISTTKVGVYVMTDDAIATVYFDMVNEDHRAAMRLMITHLEAQLAVHGG